MRAVARRTRHGRCGTRARRRASGSTRTRRGSRRDLPRSAVERLHALRRVALARRGAFREHAIDACEIVAGETYVESADVVLEILPPLGARDGHDVVALRQHPCERELGRRAAFLLCEAADLVD